MGFLCFIFEKKHHHMRCDQWRLNHRPAYLLHLGYLATDCFLSFGASVFSPNNFVNYLYYSSLSPRMRLVSPSIHVFLGLDYLPLPTDRSRYPIRLQQSLLCPSLPKKLQFSTTLTLHFTLPFGHIFLCFLTSFQWEKGLKCKSFGCYSFGIGHNPLLFITCHQMVRNTKARC